MCKNINLAICDYCSTIRIGLRYILGRKSSINVTAEASSPEEILSKFADHDIDVMLIDLGENKQGELAYLKKFRKLKPDTRIIVYTDTHDKNQLLNTIDTGVKGYLLKQAEPDEIVKAINMVYQNGTYMAPIVTKVLLEQMQHDQQQLRANLSKRERQVLGLIAKGKTNNDIANALFISIRTVKFHVSTILAKLDVKNRTEAALWDK